MKREHVLECAMEFFEGQAELSLESLNVMFHNEPGELSFLFKTSINLSLLCQDVNFGNTKIKAHEKLIILFTCSALKIKLLLN